MAHLRFFRGTELLLDYRLQQGQTSVGRSDACDVSLPGDTISRTHCVFRLDGQSLVAVDRSRHGTLREGAALERGALQDGDVLEMGPYRVEVNLGARTPLPTAPRVAAAEHEDVVAVGEDIAYDRAVLDVVAGPDQGRRLSWNQSRVSLGAAGSQVVLHGEGVVPEHCFVRVTRGRLLVEPGQGAVFLGGARVREITPVYVDEELRLGEVRVRVDRERTVERVSAGRFGEMVADSPAMHTVFGVLRRVAAHHFPVLVVGESGTGKELAARGIHEASPRADGPFVAVNCGAISRQLFESELFGHERGAFTGADRRKDGAFHRAAGGTLFLDEVGELPEAAQVKLLRTLESGEVRRVGGAEVAFPDTRVVAATNRDLSQMVSGGGFRGDLFFRLAVLMVRLPGLHERLEDLPVLARSLAARLHPEATVTPDALAVLAQHDWPGNVRELRNVLTRAYVMHGARIDADGLAFHALGASSAPPPTFDQAEKQYIQSVLARHGDNRSAAARELGIARSTLLYKIKKLGIH